MKASLFGAKSSLDWLVNTPNPLKSPTKAIYTGGAGWPPAYPKFSLHFKQHFRCFRRFCHRCRPEKPALGRHTVWEKFKSVKKSDDRLKPVVAIEFVMTLSVANGRAGMS